MLKTDVAEIDDQHKELFARIAAFAEAVRKEKGRDEVERLVEFMESYSNEHFATEEALLEKNGFPQLAAHKGHHDYFRRNVAAVKRQLQATQDGGQLVNKIYEMLSVWLFAHIKNMDLAWATFLKKKNT